jgi:hypothetical protein
LGDTLADEMPPPDLAEPPAGDSSAASSPPPPSTLASGCDVSKCKWELFVYFSGARDGNLETLLVKAANCVWGHPGCIKITDVTTKIEAGSHPVAEAVKLVLDDSLTSLAAGGGMIKPVADDLDNIEYTLFEITLNTVIAKRNRYLLAHELGHLFGLTHPTEQRDGSKPGDFASVMVPAVPSLPGNTTRQLEIAAVASNQGGWRKVVPPRIVAINTTQNIPVSLRSAGSNMFTTLASLPSAPAPFFIRNYHYDDGFPLKSGATVTVTQNLPDASQLNTAGQLPQFTDSDWWGWNSALWNVTALPQDPKNPEWYEDGFGPKHQNPQPGDNYLFIDLTIAEKFLRPISVYLYRVDLINHTYQLNPLNIVPISKTWPGILIDLLRTLIGAKTKTNKLVINSTNESLVHQKWEVNASLNWQPTSWLVAIAWDYRVSPPAELETPENLTPVSSASTDNQIHDFEEAYMKKFLDFSHTFSDAIKFGNWLKNNRCVAARRPGNPRATPLPLADEIL